MIKTQTGLKIIFGFFYHGYAYSVYGFMNTFNMLIFIEKSFTPLK